MIAFWLRVASSERGGGGFGAVRLENVIYFLSQVRPTDSRAFAALQKGSPVKNVRLDNQLRSLSTELGSKTEVKIDRAAGRRSPMTVVAFHAEPEDSKPAVRQSPA